MEITYYGHSSFKIKMDNIVIFTDPYTGDAEGGKTVLVPSKIKEADIILITHEHFDHCDVGAVENIVGTTFAKVVAPRQVLEKIKISERSKVEVKEGDKLALKGVNIEVVPARHPQSEYPIGFVLRKGSESFYFAGDTYEFPEMMHIRADLAILPIGGTYTMDPISAIVAVKNLRPKYVIPMHYGTYSNIKQNPDEFAKRFEQSTVTKVIVMQPGETKKI